MANDQALSIYYKVPKEPTEPVRWFRDMGFDQVVTEHQVIAKAAEAQGMDIVHAARVPWHEGTERKTIEDEVESVTSDYKRLDSIIMIDEPMYCDLKHRTDLFTHPIRTPSTYKKIAGWIHESGCETPLCLSFLGPSTGWTVSQRQYFADYLPAIDRLRMNVYPFLHSVPLRAITHWIDNSRQHMTEVQRQMPLTVTLQTWRYDDELPPIEQLTVMSCLVLLSGAALSFFDFNAEVWDETPGFKEGFFDMMTHGSAKCDFGLCALRDELQGKRVTHYMDRDGIFHAEASTEPSGNTSYFSINTKDEPYEDLAPFQIVRSNKPIRPYPPPDPYPSDEDN